MQTYATYFSFYFPRIITEKVSALRLFNSTFSRNIRCRETHIPGTMYLYIPMVTLLFFILINYRMRRLQFRISIWYVKISSYLKYHRNSDHTIFVIYLSTNLFLFLSKSIYFSGLWKNREEVFKLRKIQTVFKPNAENTKRYQPMIAQWKIALQRLSQWYWCLYQW